MKKHLSLFLFCAFFAEPCLAQEAPPSYPARDITLAEAFRLALARSEDLAGKGEAVTFYEARIDELQSNLRPRAAFGVSQKWQDASSPSDDPSSSSPTSQRLAAVNVHHSLFNGLRDIIAVKAAQSQTAAARLAYERARQLLYQDVASAYLNLLAIHDELDIRRKQIEITGKLISELSSREKIGRSRPSEVLAAQAQLAQNQAALAVATGQERVFQWTFRFLTGLDMDARPAVLEPPAPAKISEYLIRAHSRADVEQARRTLEYAGLFTNYQKNQKLPTADFDGNYYLTRPDGAARHVYWDATFSVSLPLYLGGSADAQVAEAQSNRRSAELALSLALRQAELDVRSAQDNLLSSLYMTAALAKALAAAQANEKAQEADYRYGLVTNLDVLTAQTASQNTMLQLSNAKVAAQAAKIRLEVAAGGPGN
ncbi:MAG: TolC family protein [Elusimicrobiales bacterium]|nr:TolC family protein [Elusimicrobiales bacterium]